MEKAIVVFSGGPDSTAAALWALASGYEVTLVTIEYRGKQQYGEIKASMDVAAALGLPHVILDFRSIMASFSPFAHIMMHAGTTAGNAGSTSGHLMPFGAGMVLSIMANYALYNGIKNVVWGATKDDGSSGRYEYGREFADELANLISKASGSGIAIHTPFAGLHKHQVVRDHFSGREALFAMTWSCKRGGVIQSGDCHASIARRVAAELGGIKDTTTYKVKAFTWPAGLPKDPKLVEKDPSLLARVLGSEPEPRPDVI